MKLSFKNFIFPALFILFFGFTSCTPETPPPPPVNPAEQFVGSYKVDWTHEWTVYLPSDTTEYSSGTDTLEVTLGSIDSSVFVIGTQINISMNSYGNYHGSKVTNVWGTYGEFYNVTFFGGDSIACSYHSTGSIYEMYTNYLGKKL